MLYLKEQEKDFTLGIWKIDESKEELFDLFGNKYFLDKDIQGLKSDNKILERLSVRALLKTLLNEEVNINYHKSGKPFIAKNNLNISISHTKGYVAVLLSPNNEIGVDIQHITPKVLQVQNRFIAENEYIVDNEDKIIHLLLHWAAKETLYKAIGTGVNLKKSFCIEKFTPKSEGSFRATYLMSNPKKTFNIQYMVTSDFVFTYTTE
ncbi:MAG: 4'-phosphopantetheinyl transferase family protein [Dysgonomonas sp.]